MRTIRVLWWWMALLGLGLEVSCGGSDDSGSPSSSAGSGGNSGAAGPSSDASAGTLSGPTDGWAGAGYGGVGAGASGSGGQPAGGEGAGGNAGVSGSGAISAGGSDAGASSGASGSGGLGAGASVPGGRAAGGKVGGSAGASGGDAGGSAGASGTVSCDPSVQVCECKCACENGWISTENTSAEEPTCQARCDKVCQSEGGGPGTVVFNACFETLTAVFCRSRCQCGTSTVTSSAFADSPEQACQVICEQGPYGVFDAVLEQDCEPACQFRPSLPGCPPVESYSCDCDCHCSSCQGPLTVTHSTGTSYTATNCNEFCSDECSASDCWQGSGSGDCFPNFEPGGELGECDSWGHVPQECGQVVDEIKALFGQEQNLTCSQPSVAVASDARPCVRTPSAVIDGLAELGVCLLGPYRADLDFDALLAQAEDLGEGTDCRRTCAGTSAPIGQCRDGSFPNIEPWCVDNACASETICPCADGETWLPLENECDGVADCPDESDEDCG